MPLRSSTVPHSRVRLTSSGPGRTKQSFKDETDINVIMARYIRGLPVTSVQHKAPWYGDFSQSSDFHTTLNRVAEAELAFSTLPAELRERFNNSTEKLIAFLANPDNADEAVQLGLFEAPPSPPEESISVPTPPPEGGETPPVPSGGE